MRLFEVYQSIRIRESEDDKEKIERRFKEIQDLLKKYPEMINHLYRVLHTEIEGEHRFRPEDHLIASETEPERDHINHESELINALRSAEGDFDEVRAFVMNYGSVDYVDMNSLTTEGVTQNWDDWLQGEDKIGVSKEFIKSLFRALFMYQPMAGGSRRGPGEMALCLLSPNITYIGSNGDIDINGVSTEVKAAGGRLRKDSRDFGDASREVDPIFKKAGLDYKVTRLTAAPNPRLAAYSNFVEAARELEEIQEGTGADMIKALLTTIYPNAARTSRFPELLKKIISEMKSATPNLQECALAANTIAMLNYGAILLSENCTHYLFLNQKKDIGFYVAVKDLEKHLDKFRIATVTWTSGEKTQAPQFTIDS